MTETIVLTAEMVAVMAILAITIFLFAFEIVRVDVAAVGIMVLLGLTSMLPGYAGLVPIGNLFDGFSSNAVISIIAVMIIGAGLGVAMGNARQEVQDAADHVVGCHESDGLLELVEIMTSR